MPQIDIVLTAEGQIGIYVQDGSFPEGKASIEAILELLGTRMPLTNVSAVESHRPNADQVEQQHRHHLPAPGGLPHDH
jgi:hypothetical protein